MAVETNAPVTGRFVTAVLPWLAGAGALLVFALTLDRWVSLASLGTMARVSGWVWQPKLYHPITAMLLRPFRLLPEPWLPGTLNLVTAGCAALALAFLARSVALLPYGLPPDGRLPQSGPLAAVSPRTAWIPPVLAVMVGGLQLTFWEHATSATGEMFDLLIFAYIMRCLLEFHTDRKESWLTRSAFLYAAAMAGNWPLIVYSPIFLVTVVRLNGLEHSRDGYRILNTGLLLRVCLWGLAGLSLYLLLPGLASLSSVHHLDFWPALKDNLRFQKANLSLFKHTGLGLMALTTFPPLLVMSFRWRLITAQSGDDTALAVFITRAAIHFVHAVFLAVSLWLALDPSFSLRKMGFGASALTQDFISALVVGYCSGYFLLVAARAQAPSHGSPGRASRLADRARRKATPLGKSAACLITAVIGLLLVAVPVALAWRNLGQIRATNGPALHEFARQLCNRLPAGQSVALSDDLTELFLLQAELGTRGAGQAALPLDTRELASGQYQRFMARQFKELWPVASDSNRGGEGDLMPPPRLLFELSRKEPLVYLHPSLDYCFEQFAERPDGPVHRLREPPVEDVIGQKLDEQAATVNEQYWQQQWTGSLQALAGPTGEQTGQPPHWAGQVFDRLHLTTEGNRSTSFLAVAYARSLDYWGVQMQQLGHWKEAGVWYQRALELNPGNLAAQINLEYNQRHQKGDPARLAPEALEARFATLFGEYRDWKVAVDDNGPVDEPTYLFRTAVSLWAGQRYRQATGGFRRCAELAPDWLDPKIGLAEGYLVLGDFASALRLTESLRAFSPPQNGKDEARVVSCQARALWGLGRREEALAYVGGRASQQSEQTDVLDAVAQLYLQWEQPGPALALLDRLVNDEPNNVEFLANKGVAELGLKRYDDGIATLTKALELNPANAAVRFNRANAALRAGRLDAASADYQELLKQPPNSFQAQYGLAEIALRKQDTNSATELYQRCLSDVRPESKEYKLVSYRLKQLQGK